MRDDEPIVDILDEREFYELMQVYRWSGMIPTIAEQEPVSEAYEDVKKFIREHYKREDD